MAGLVPVFIISDNQDFEKITQCLLHKNNPAPVPQSMGAFLANGLVNWNRLHALEKNWLPAPFSGNLEPGIFKKCAARPRLV